MKNKKILKVAVMLSLATTLVVPFNTLADSQGTRIGGRDRFEVAINVANKFTNAKSCIVLNYLAYSDSISSSEIAKGDMPIYYTKSDSIDSNTLKDIRNKGYKNVFIIGGEKSVSKNVENELAKISNITRVSGQNRYDVNYKTLNKNKENLIVVSGENFADGLVSSTLAKIKNATIAITPNEEIHPNILKYLKENKKLKNIYIVGGEKSVSKKVENKLSEYAKTVRVSGHDRYQTSEELAKQISDKYIIVSGENFADNLVAGTLARKTNRSIVLSKRADFTDTVKNIAKTKDFIVVGGEKSISDDIFKWDNKTEYTTKTETVKEEIKFKEIRKADNTLEKGQEKVKQEGENGLKEVTYKDIYVDGLLVKAEKESEKILKPVKDKIILVGTKEIDYYKPEKIPTTKEELYNYYNVDYNEPLSTKEQAIFNELNRVRKEHGLQELKLSKTLTRTARIHARDSALLNEVTHKWSPKLLEMVKELKFKKKSLGAEVTWVVGWDDDAKYVIQGFMDSPAHKEILMADDNVYVGIGRYDSKFDFDKDGIIEPRSRIFIEVYGEDEFNELDYIPD